MNIIQIDDKKILRWLCETQPVFQIHPHARNRKAFRFTRRIRRTCRRGQVRQIDGWREDLRRVLP